MKNLEKKVLQIIQSHAPEGDDPLGLDTPLSEIGIDSVDMIEIVFEIEDEFEIDIPDPTSIEDRFFGNVSIRELVVRVAELVDLKNSSHPTNA